MRSTWTLIALFVMATPGLTEPAYRGMSYTSWGRYALSSTASDQSLDSMRQAGVNMAAINVWEFQDSPTSTVITPDYTLYSSDPDALRHGIRKAKALGMDVMLKPNIDSRDGAWRGTFQPSNAWFAAYADFIVKYARLAQEEGVAMLSIGCEYNQTQHWGDSWREVIRRVREVYSGKLTYAANHDAFKSIGWWGDLDIIGIDAYFPLTNSKTPTPSELDLAWLRLGDDIGGWRAAQYPALDVIFAEVGYRSADGANQAPWEWSQAMPLDLQEQADCYDALLKNMWNRSWWQGAFWWNWETDPWAGGPNDTGFTPQGKPALDVLQQYYKPVPEPATLMGLGVGIGWWARGRLKAAASARRCSPKAQKLK